VAGNWRYTFLKNSEQKANMLFALMPVRSCRVTIQDMDGVSHTVEVSAATLYEAVAQGLAAIRGNEWVAGIAQGLNVGVGCGCSRRARGQADGFYEVAGKDGRLATRGERSSPDSVDPGRAGFTIRPTGGMLYSEQS
jgi:hypothetical protein